MTPRPNSLFHWIPLLCLIWTASASAQAWTTVWTPDSTPAIRTTGADGGTHESKTNCYPCKVWDKGANSGKGGWTPLPATTEPIQCASDTNDYTCKECDGAGGVRNKADDSDCFINEKSGKCCEGVCIEIPSEGTDPCLWAAGNDDFRNDHAGFFQPVTGPEGFTICIFGEPYPCVPPDNIPQAWKWANIDTCVERHEQYHVDHSPIQCPPCGTGIGTYADAATSLNNSSTFKMRWILMDTAS